VKTPGAAPNACTISNQGIQAFQHEARGWGGSPLNRGDDAREWGGQQDEVALVVEAIQFWERAQAAIGHLPRSERAVLLLYYFHGSTMQEIGTIMGVTESRASQLHHSALSRLRVRMRRFAA
jgi:RNA polymerase sigma factor (sigma-70 family)